MLVRIEETHEFYFLFLWLVALKEYNSLIDDSLASVCAFAGDGSYSRLQGKRSQLSLYSINEIFGFFFSPFFLKIFNVVNVRLYR